MEQFVHFRLEIGIVNRLIYLPAVGRCGSIVIPRDFRKRTLQQVMQTAFS